MHRQTRKYFTYFVSLRDFRLVLVEFVPVKVTPVTMLLDHDCVSLNRATVFHSCDALIVVEGEACLQLALAACAADAE